MEPTVNQILQQAIASHKEGKIEEAEKSYKKAIELNTLLNFYLISLEQKQMLD